MPVYRGVQVIAASSSFSPNLSPNDRFGGRGGTVRVRSLQLTGQAATDVSQTVFIGNEMVENRGNIDVEAAATPGITNFTPALEAVGLPADAIAVRYDNNTAVAKTIKFFIEIENY